MKNIYFVLLLLTLSGLSLGAMPSLPTKGQEDRPHLFILGGELSNSAATSVEDIDKVMPRMKALGLNTVLVPACWDLMEPQEGQFDFTLIDRTISQARQQQLKVVFLWFGVWKNSMSCYTPQWVKTNTRRFPRAMTTTGKPLEIVSAFSDEVLKADNRAFEALMKHIKEVDANSETVIMMQIENEIGMLEDARDHSQLAEEVYRKGVPEQLLTYLKKNKLHPWLQQRVNLKGKSWKEVFGDDLFSDEVFMAYSYAIYVETLAQTARKYASMPLYVNAAMNSRGRKPGEYPSAGPLAHLIDLWHAGAPTIDMLSPDIYDAGFKGWADRYALWNNRLFIPETRCSANAAARAFYTFGEHRALGFCPFAIDKAAAKEVEPITKAYRLLNELRPLLMNNKISSWGLLFDQQEKERVIDEGKLRLTCRHYFTLPWDARATDGSVWPEGGAVVMRLAPNDYLIAGTGVVVSFATAYEQQFAVQRQLGEDGFVLADPQHKENLLKTQSNRFAGKRMGLLFVDEVKVEKDGTLTYLRRHNGDEDHQGRHARIAVGDFKILHVKLYEY
ncbi:MAG: DUF5597 domain-containing protein [Prevotella sp.]